MLHQNIKIGYRNLLKNKTYSILKIGGFAIGIATFLLILLFVRDELSYDQHLSQEGRVYRLLNVTSNDIFQFKQWTSFSAEIGRLLNEDYPEIETAGRVINRDWFLAGENQFRPLEEKQTIHEEKFAYADPSILDIMEMPMVYGTHEEALKQPFSLVLSKKIANKYFPNQDPVGEVVILNENLEQPYTIGGVVDYPENSHFQFEFLLTLSGVEFWPGEQTSWCCQNYDVYMRLHEGADKVALEKKLLAIKNDFIVKELIDTKNPLAEVIKEHRTFALQPFGEIYLKSPGVFDNYLHGDFRMVGLFGLIAVFILILAGINFVNLFTARAANRAKEVGVRKVTGSQRSDLIRQFLTESTLYSAVSVVLGALIAKLGMPFFNTLTNKSLDLPLLDWWFGPGLLTLTLLIGLLAGMYPAFYLSSFRPASVLKGALSRGSKGSRLRSVMVVFQFTISIVLIISAAVVYNQMQYILNKDIGFDKEQVLLIQGASTLGEKKAVMEQELKRLPQVESVTSSSSFPVDGTLRNNNQFWIEGEQELSEGASGQNWRVAHNYIPSMKMKLVAGRNFEEKLASADSTSVIINETMAKDLGLEDPIGAQIRNFRPWTVIGVVEDFHFENMKSEIRPLALFRNVGAASTIAVRIQTEDMAATLNSVVAIWDEFMPNQRFRYEFLDASYAKMYEATRRTADIFATCAFLAILIACLGLFGLATFMATQRSKEIGIRKVLGASVLGLVQLVSRDFILLVFIAIFLATPVAWYVMDLWLETFTYKIDIKVEVFALAGIMALSIALLTVSFQSIKAALADPVDSLRNE